MRERVRTRLEAMVIPFRTKVHLTKRRQCPICGVRVNRPAQYVRHAGIYMFPWGMIPDDHATFSPAHRRCLELGAVGPEYIYSDEERKALEEDADDSEPSR